MPKASGGSRGRRWSSRPTQIREISIFRLVWGFRDCSIRKPLRLSTRRLLELSSVNRGSAKSEASLSTCRANRWTRGKRTKATDSDSLIGTSGMEATRRRSGRLTVAGLSPTATSRRPVQSPIGVEVASRRATTAVPNPPSSWRPARPVWAPVIRAGGCSRHHNVPSMVYCVSPFCLRLGGLRELPTQPITFSACLFF
jgi:hypothetical protein